MGRVEGKVALITGAARGQGRAHAVRLVQEGASIVALDICKPVDGMPVPPSTREDLDQTAKLVEDADGRILTLEVDVRDEDGLVAAVAAGRSEFGRLDIVVANAGTSSFGRALEMSRQDWQTVIDVNLTGVWLTCKAAIPEIIAGERGGSVILTSSVGGLRGYENIAHYIAAKHGVVGLMRTLALELAPHMIRVNTVHPGAVKTPLMLNDATMKMFSPEIEEPTYEDITRVAEGMSTLPVAWLDPMDIANAVLHLASDEARYITGTTSVVDMGQLLK